METIAVWFSCGVASAVAAKKTIEKYGATHLIRIINSPIKEEHPDNQRFLKDVEAWLGVEIEIATNDKYPDCSCVTVWKDRKFMSSPYGAPCTGELKKEARKQWEARNHADHHVLGFTFGEQGRHDRFVLTERPLLPILIDAKLTKGDCFNIVKNAGIELPGIYKLGYPNANCIGCVKATSPTYWNHVRKHHPEVFEARARQSLEIGAKLVRYKGERIQLVNLPPDAVGHPLKDMDFECGIFCEEGLRPGVNTPKQNQKPKRKSNMAQHFKYSGSTAARTIGCPAWLRLSDDIPVIEGGGSNPAADQGTMLHNCMEEMYEDKNIPACFLEMLEAGREYNDEKLTQELVETKLDLAFEAMENLIDDHDIGEWKVEPFVKIDNDIGGSIDFLGISTDSKTVVVVDYKFGYVPVDVTHNKQLLFYALAAACDENTREWFDAVETVILVIIQPNENGPVMQKWCITMDQVDEFETEYLAAVEASEDQESLPASGSWCKYCPVHATCPVKTGAALKATRVNEITSDKLAEYLPLAAEVMEWAKEVQKMAHAQLELGAHIKGYKLVNKRASRVWNDKPAVDHKVRKAKKIKIEDGFELKLKSPAQLEKVCKKLDVDFEKNYGQYISAVSSGTTLVPESDPRSAALPVQGLAQLNAMND